MFKKAFAELVCGTRTTLLKAGTNLVAIKVLRRSLPLPRVVAERAVASHVEFTRGAIGARDLPVDPFLPAPGSRALPVRHSVFQTSKRGREVNF